MYLGLFMLLGACVKVSVLVLIAYNRTNLLKWDVLKVGPFLTVLFAHWLCGKILIYFLGLFYPCENDVA